MKYLLLSLFLLSNVYLSRGQNTTESVQYAFGAGSAKELMKYFNKVTEVKINSIGSDYNLSQAEPVFRDFFKQNPPLNFEYIHKGQSPQGLKYNIAQYVSGEKTYRVVILLKKDGDTYFVDTINLNEQ